MSSSWLIWKMFLSNRFYSAAQPEYSWRLGADLQRARPPILLQSSHKWESLGAAAWVGICAESAQRHTTATPSGVRFFIFTFNILSNWFQMLFSFRFWLYSSSIVNQSSISSHNGVPTPMGAAEFDLSFSAQNSPLAAAAGSGPTSTHFHCFGKF